MKRLSCVDVMLIPATDTDKILSEPKVLLSGSNMHPDKSYLGDKPGSAIKSFKLVAVVTLTKLGSCEATSWWNSSRLSVLADPSWPAYSLNWRTKVKMAASMLASPAPKKNN